MWLAPARYSQNGSVKTSEAAASALCQKCVASAEQVFLILKRKFGVVRSAAVNGACATSSVLAWRTSLATKFSVSVESSISLSILRSAQILRFLAACRTSNPSTLASGMDRFANATVAEKLKDVPGMISAVKQICFDVFVHLPFMYFPAFYTVKEFCQGEVEWRDTKVASCGTICVWERSGVWGEGAGEIIV